MSVELEGYRFRYDDGDEDEATPAADADTDISMPRKSRARLRVLLDTTGGPTTIVPRLEYSIKYPGGSFGDWVKVMCAVTSSGVEITSDGDPVYA
jgi:hypothetical protein